MLLKYTLKNILSKPGRLIIILICMTAACFTGFLAVDFGNSFKGFLSNMLGGLVGKTDYLITYEGKEGITDEIFVGLPGCEYVCMNSLDKLEIRRDEKLYSYAITDSVSVYAFNDMNATHAIELIPADVSPADGEIAVSKDYSEKFGYKEGDIINLSDKDYKQHPFTVKGIYEDPPILGSYSAIISDANYRELMGENPYYMALVHLFDENDREAFKDMMEEKHPNVVCMRAYITDESTSVIDSIAAVLYLVFVLVFILVIFVTVSFTEKIITERMSVIGTLRSIGMSMRKTTAILLFENILYGIVGSVIALVIYLVLRKKAIDSISELVEINVGSVKLNYGMMALVILGALLIQVIVPLKEVLKAVKTSIRDIIFETRDSEYKLSYPKTIAGAVCIVLGLIIGFAFNSLYMSATAVLLLIVGCALSIQFIVRKLTLLLAKVFSSRNMPVAELAATETGSKKPNSGNAVLTVASVAAAAAIFVILNSIIFALNKPTYDTDIIVSGASLKTAKYDYIKDTEGITECEFIYETTENVTLRDDDKQYALVIMSMPETGQFKAMGDLPSDTGKYDMIIDTPAANKMQISEGESIDITFHAEGVFPLRKTLTVRRITEDTQFGSSGTIILAKELYKELFPDTVSSMLIRTGDPAAVKNIIEPTFTKGENVKTMEEYAEEEKKGNGMFMAVMIGIMIASVALTLIGISGNQLIGFAARKKEYAMLHSCACSRSKIIRLILTENALLFGISCIVAGIVCIPVSILISRIFVQADMGIYVTVRYNTLIICIIILWLVTMFTSLSPIKSLKKMNTAMELKYE